MKGSCFIFLLLISFFSLKTNHSLAQNFDRKYTAADLGIYGEVTQVIEQVYYRGSTTEEFKAGTNRTYLFNSRQEIQEIVEREIGKGVVKRTHYLYSLTNKLDGLRIDDQQPLPVFISLAHDSQGRLTRAVTSRGGKSGIIDYSYGSGPKPVLETRTNTKSEVYRKTEYTYDQYGSISSEKSTSLYDQKTSSKTYTYFDQDQYSIEKIAETEENGAKSELEIYSDQKGHVVRRHRTSPSGFGDYDYKYGYELDLNDNWIRQYTLRDGRYKFEFRLRKIVYANGNVEGRLFVEPTDAYVQWRKSAGIWYVSVDDQDVRQQTQTSYLVESDDALGYDLNSGLSFLLPGFRNDTSYTWKPVENLRHGTDLHWIANDKGFWVYYKGNFTPSREAIFVNDDVLVYLPVPNRSFLLKNYNAHKDGTLHEAISLDPNTNAFWYKTDANNYRLIVNGAYPESNLPNEWANSKKDIIIKQDGKSRYRLNGYANALIGQLYPASNY